VESQELLSWGQCSEVEKRAKKEVGYSGKHRINGLKRHLVIEANGHPLNFTLSTANRNDLIKLLETIDGIRIGKRKRNPKRLGLDKGYDSEPHRRALRQRRIIPSPLIARTMSQFHAAAPQKRFITGGIAANAGKWNGRLVGSTIGDAWTACWNTDRKRIGLSCESFSCSTIL
jgi:hypothetical protein